MRIVLADDQKQRIDHVRRVLLGEGLTCDADDVVDYQGLQGRLAGQKADLILVTLDGAREEALAAIQTARQMTNAPILAADAGTEAETIRQAIRAGASELVSLDRLREELSEVLTKIEAGGHAHNQRGILISLFSPSGGAGVSTTAVNLAVRLAGTMPDRVALIELKPAPGDLALMLDLEPKHTLDHICRSWERLDQKMLEAAMVRHRSGVRVLAQTGYPQNGDLCENTLSTEAVRQLCTLTRRMHALTVADLSHELSEQQVEAMRLSNLVGLIARPDVLGLRRARWALDTVRARGVPGDRFRLVLNRFGQTGQIDLAKAEQILGIQVFHRIPEDHRLANRAVNLGIPLTESSKRSRISRSFSSLARNVQSSCGSLTG